MAINQEFEFESKKTECPCGASKKFCRLKGHADGGKCWDDSCDRKFFPPSKSIDDAKKSATNGTGGAKSNGVGVVYKHDRTHVYRTPDGENLLFRVNILKSANGKKRAYQQRFTGTIKWNDDHTDYTESGRWDNGLENTPLTLYGSWLLDRWRSMYDKNAADQRLLFIVEGEKDCESLWDNSIPAVCNPMGSGKWRDEFSPLLAGFDVVILPDNDEPGIKHADQVATSVTAASVANSVRILNLWELLPELPPKGDVTDYLALGGTAEDITSAVERIASWMPTKPEIPHVFWYEAEVRNSSTPALKIKYTELFDYFRASGVRRIKLNPADMDSNSILVVMRDNVVTEIDVKGMQSMLYGYVHTLPLFITSSKTKMDLHEVLGKGIHVYVGEAQTNYFVSPEYVKFVKDTSDSSFLFFKNGFVTVTRDGYSVQPYTAMTGYIWSSQIIQHELNIITDGEKLINSDFARFTKNLCSTRDTSEETRPTDVPRWISLITSLGYLLHLHKTQANVQAVVLTEANVELDKARGGTGKGLLIQAISKMRKTVIFDGKNFDFDYQFSLERLGTDTSVALFDDVPKGFDFKRLFSMLTDGMTYNRRNKSEIHLSVMDSPKVAITTNYSILENSGSANRRKAETELLCYYGDKHRPIDDFKRDFFYSWDIDEWDVFYTFMLSCLHTYFAKGAEITGFDSDTVNRKKLVNATSADFAEFADKLPRNTDLSAAQIYEEFINTYDADPKVVSKTRFGIWVKRYCEFNKLTYKRIVLRVFDKIVNHHNLSTQE